MKTIRFILLTGAVAAGAALAGPAQSQAMAGHDHHASSATTKSASPKPVEMSEGEVRKVDLESRRITLKHGPLKNLDMPAMTMPFQVTDPAMLGKVKVGDKVHFVAANPGGNLTITDIQVTQ